MLNDLLSLVLMMTLILGVTLNGILVATLTPASVPATSPTPPTPAPTSPPNSVFATTTPFVYAVNSHYDENTYVAIKWQAAGTLYDPGDQYSGYQSIEACSLSPCSLFLTLNASQHLISVARFAGFRIQELYVNESTVVVLGTPPSDAEWVIPASDQIPIGRADAAGMAIVYNRYANGSLSYARSTLVSSSPAAATSFAFNKGFMGLGKIFVAMSGACPEESSWTFTPMRIQHAANDSDELTLGCSQHQAVGLMYQGQGLAEAAWTLEGGQEISVNALYATSEGPSYFILYGSYVSLSEGEQTLNALRAPIFATSLVPGEIPTTSSPPGPAYAWPSSRRAAFAARYDPTNYDFIDLARLDATSTRVRTNWDGASFSMCGDTSGFSYVSVYAFNASVTAALFNATDPEPLERSPYCCAWSMPDGTVSACNVYRGTAQAFVSHAEPRTLTAITPGTLQQSDDFNLENTNVTFTIEEALSMTLPVAGVLSQSSYGGYFDDGALVYDGSNPGEYVYSSNNYNVWFAVAGGVQYWID
jgi:hypothetical protein